MSKVKGFGRTNRILTGNFVQKIAHIYSEKPIFVQKAVFGHYPDSPHKSADF